MSRVAFITGVNGQDGSYLSELLLEKGYDVHGMIRRTSQFSRLRIEETRRLAETRGQVFELHYGNMSDATSLHRLIALCRPDEIYNLASQSHVGVSFEEPEYAADVNALGVLRLLECMRQIAPQARLYQASSSELFGDATEFPQTESTPFHPRTPYGVSKLYAYWIVHNYRDAYGLHGSNGILFNHESPRRGENFVTRKITYSLARIRAGLQQRLRLGNLEATRDWGFAGDYVDAMWRMLQQERPDDYVVATGESHTVREFVALAAEIAGTRLEWDGEGANAKGRDAGSGEVIVEVDPRFYRPAEVGPVQGDAAKARERLGWTPRVRFPELVERMMRADLDLVRRGD